MRHLAEPLLVLAKKIIYEFFSAKALCLIFEAFPYGKHDILRHFKAQMVVAIAIFSGLNVISRRYGNADSAEPQLAPVTGGCA